MSANPTRRRIIGSAGAIAVVVAGVAIVTVAHVGTTKPAAASSPHVSSARVPRRSHSSHKHVTRRGPPVPLTLLASSPATGATSAPASGVITLRFSTAVAKSSPMPTTTPAIAGRWNGAGTSTIVFTPATRFMPSEHVSVALPGGGAGMLSSSGQRLARPEATSFTVAPVTVLRLQQLLAELGYLPVNFDASVSPGATATTSPAAATTASSPAATTAALDGEASSASLVSLAARQGTFSWRFPNIPTQLAAAWQPGVWSPVTEGAVMAFESDHGLGVDGVPGPQVWTALLQAVASRDSTTRPYDYLIVTETQPETLYVWRNGSVIYQSLANTGIAGATTQLGTWPVYLRYLSQTMSGTNPNGTTYSDPGVPYVAYFNGSDAVHGFPRASYGFPQSVGCVELPIANASVVFGTDPYGTLVTVTTGALAAELSGTGSAASSTPTTVPPTTVPPTTVPPTTVPPTTVPPTTVPPATTSSAP